MAETTTVAPVEHQEQPASPAPAAGPILKPPKKKRKWGRWVLLVVALLIVGLVVYTSIMAALAKPVVLYQPAAAQDIDSIISTSGTIAAQDTHTYFVPAQVKVKAVNFKRGDQVKKGEVIATFDMSDLQISLEKARLSMENAQLQYDQTMEDVDESSNELYELNKTIRKENAKLTNLEMAYKYYDVGHTGDPDIDKLIAAYVDNKDGLYDDWQKQGQAVAGLMAQRSALRNLEMDESQQKIMDNNLALQKLQYDEVAKMVNESQGGIIAEFDGILTQLNLVEGATVSPGMTAAVLEKNEDIKITFSLNKYDIQSLALGQPATVTFGGHKLTGTVTRIDGAATTVGASAVVMAEVSVEDPDHLLKLGMDADLDILTASRQGTVAVPIETVKTDKAGDYVYILTPTQGEKAKQGEFDFAKVYIEAGISDDSYMEILSGVEAGDLVATVTPKGVESGAVVTGIPGTSSGGMLQLPGGITVEQPDTME